MSFQIGDRVRINPECLGRSIGGFLIGEEHIECPATIVLNAENSYIGIAFDEPIGIHGWNVCDPGHGLWVKKSHLLYETEISSIEEADLLEVLSGG